MLKIQSTKAAVDLQRMQDELKLYTAAGRLNSAESGKLSFKFSLIPGKLLLITYS
jgi:hypothetical protein